MGIYNITIEEFERKFEEFLRSFEGDVPARLIVITWNRLAQKHKWNDRIMKEE